MSRILSIDVGKRNLAICELDIHSRAILSWRNLDLLLLEQEEVEEKKKECDECAKTASHVRLKDGAQRCSFHLKSEPSTSNKAMKDLSPLSVLSYSKSELTACATKYSLEAKGLKKPELVELLLRYVHDFCFCPKGQGSKVRVALNRCSASSPDVSETIRLAYSIRDTLGHFYSRNSAEFVYIVIENQLGQTATKNRETQLLLTQSFAHIAPTADIRYVSAVNKLRGRGKKEKEEEEECESASSKKRKRKLCAIEECSLELESDEKYEPFRTMFANSKKKDDLSDSFLQGLWFLENKMK